MEVILLERVHNLGQIGDVVNVKPGYARNFLLPLRKALRATQANKSKFEAQRAMSSTVEYKPPSPTTSSMLLAVCHAPSRRSYPNAFPGISTE